MDDHSSCGKFMLALAYATPARAMPPRHNVFAGSDYRVPLSGIAGWPEPGGRQGGRYLRAVARWLLAFVVAIRAVNRR